MNPFHFVQTWQRGGLFTLLLLGCLLPGRGQSVPFPCDGAFYLSHTKELDSHSTFFRIQFDEGKNLWRWDTLIADMGRQVYPIGYRVTDQLIYGLDAQSHELLNIDAGGQIEVSAQLELDTSYYYTAGSISPNGKYFILVGQDKESGIDKKIFFLNLDAAGNQAGSFSILSQGDVQMGDLAPSPLRRAINGFDALGKSLLFVGYYSGVITRYQFVSSPQVGSIGSTFFDREGRLFGFGRNPGNVTKDHMLFQIDATEGDIIAIQPGPSGKITDGCSCPYTISFEKQADPAIALYCDTITLTYRWDNRSGGSYVRRSLVDSLPPELTIVDVPYVPNNATVEKGPGESLLQVALGDFLLGPDSVTVKVVVNGNFRGRFGSRARLSDFPKAFGYIVRSEDPATTLSDDSTFVTVQDLKVSLEAPARICPGNSAEIASKVIPEGKAVSYRWSDGSTGNSLVVTQGGWYKLEVTHECGFAVDSIFIEVPAVPLAVDLGPRQNIEQGEMLQLQYQANEPGPFTYAWTAKPAGEVFCQDCPRPEVRPLRSTRYILTLTDAYGCTATDSVEVWVDENKEVEIDNVFTPNDDGINEVLYFYGKGLVQVRQFQVFDRWGKQVFESPGGSLNDPAHGWNGRKNGKVLPAGVYFWMVELEYPDATQEVRKGSVTLMK